MKTTENITTTQGRLKKALSTQIEPLLMPKIEKQINKVANDSKFQTGIMTKFYPHLDKCEINVNGNLILCKVLHRFYGDIIDYYTPLGDEEYCDRLHEPCVVPREELECLILDVNDDSNEQIFVGYISSDELLGANPAQMGNLKLLTRTATNQFWIKFGVNGLDIRSPETPTTNVGEMQDTMVEVNYSDSNNTYSKEEIDKIIADLRTELIGENDTNDAAG